MAEGHPIDCGFAVVHPWLCDAMGHLTTRHYLGMFDDATYHLFATLGHAPAQDMLEHRGWADVRHEIDYRSELAAGALVRIDGRVTSIGRTSVGIEYHMFERTEDRLCAALAARTVCFDLKQRRAQPLPENFIARVAERFGIHA